MSYPAFSIHREGKWLEDQGVESIDREEVWIGRDLDCVIRLDDPAVSRRHARVKKTAEGLLIQKSSEFGPMLVNGTEVSHAHLKEGDVISIGPYLLGVKESGTATQDLGDFIAPMPEISALSTTEKTRTRTNVSLVADPILKTDRTASALIKGNSNISFLPEETAKQNQDAPVLSGIAPLEGLPPLDFSNQPVDMGLSEALPSLDIAMSAIENGPSEQAPTHFADLNILGDQPLDSSSKTLSQHLNVVQPAPVESAPSNPILDDFDLMAPLTPEVGERIATAATIAVPQSSGNFVESGSTAATVAVQSLDLEALNVESAPQAAELSVVTPPVFNESLPPIDFAVEVANQSLTPPATTSPAFHMPAPTDLSKSQTAPQLNALDGIDLPTDVISADAAPGMLTKVGMFANEGAAAVAKAFHDGAHLVSHAVHEGVKKVSEKFHPVPAHTDATPRASEAPAQSAEQQIDLAAPISEAPTQPESLDAPVLPPLDLVADVTESVRPIDEAQASIQKQQTQSNSFKPQDSAEPPPPPAANEDIFPDFGAAPSNSDNQSNLESASKLVSANSDNVQPPEFNANGSGQNGDALGATVALSQNEVDFNMGGASGAPVNQDAAPDASNNFNPGNFESGNPDRTILLSNAPMGKLLFKEGDSNHVEFKLQKPEISIGRGRNCDLILNDTQASRKHALLIREGNRYILRDLGSGNGTYVDGRPIKEHTLSTDDVIRIGNVEFQFVALDPNYASAEAQISPVSPDEISIQNLTRANIQSPNAIDSAIGAEPIAGVSNGDPIAGIDNPTEKLTGIARYIEGYKRLGRLQRLLVLVAIAAGALYFYDEQLFNQYVLMEPPPKKVLRKEKPKVKPSSSPAVSQQAAWDKLTDEQKRFIETQYQLAFDHLSRKEYDQCIFEVQKIFALLPEYEKGRELERYAREAKKTLEAFDAEKKRHAEEEERRAQLEKIVAEAAALMSEKKYPEAQLLFPDILAVDPDHPKVAEWRKEIEEYQLELARQAEAKLVQERLYGKVQAQFMAAKALQSAQKFQEAIDAFEEVLELESKIEEFESKVPGEIQACKDSIQALRDPLIMKGKEFEAQGELAKAFREYEHASRIDPTYPEAFLGMDRIRGVLTEQAKGIYTKGVLSESYSDFDDAQRQFESILGIAPEGSLYWERAQRKLNSYKHFRKPANDPFSGE